MLLYLDPPRTQVASVPFALNAEHANSAEWASINGKPSNLVTGTASNGQVALWNSGSTITGSTGITYAGSNLSIAGGLNVGTATGAASGEVRTSAYVSQQLPFSPFSELPSNIPATIYKLYSVTVMANGTIIEWDTTWITNGTNNASNYWTVNLNEGDTGGQLATFNTSAGAGSAYTRNSKPGLNISIATGMMFLYIDAIKTGTPGNFYLNTPAIFVK